MGWALGIDGGGTKTEYLLAGPGAKRGVPFRGGPTSLTRATPDAVRLQLAVGIQAVTLAAGIHSSSINTCYGGFAGAGDAAAARRLQDMLRELLPSARLHVTTDMEIAWAGACGGGDGIVVISGTGSAAYGRKAGMSARAGGHGPVERVVPRAHSNEPSTGDLGSGDWIRDRAGRGVPETTAAAAAGDTAAAAVLSEAGNALAALAVEVAGRLGWTDPDVYPTGGVFQGSEPVRRAFTVALAESLPQAKVLAPRQPPVQGALTRAREQR